MDKLILYADFDFFAEPQPIGELYHERIRGNSVFLFIPLFLWDENSVSTYHADLRGLQEEFLKAYIQNKQYQ